jgi:hypothetical protein
VEPTLPIGAVAASRVADAIAALGSAAEAARPLGIVGGTLLVAAGLVALTVASRFRRALAVVGGAGVGALAAVALRGFVAAHLGLSPVLTVALGAAAGGVGCGIYPLAFPIAAGALPGALLGYPVPLMGRALLGAAAGGLIGAVVGAGFARVVAAAFASVLGGAALAIGLGLVFGAWPPVQDLAARPITLAAVTLVAAVAGTAFQIGRRGAGRRDGRPSGAPPPLRAPDR